MKALLFDTETSGLIDNRTLPVDKQPSVIEFYGLVADLATGAPDLIFHELIKPPRPVTEEITKITGITNEMIADKPPFIGVAEGIRMLIESAPLVIAHNLSFDVEMLDVEFGRLGRKLEWPRKLCTVEATVHLRGIRLSLQALHEHLFDEGFPGAHRAEADVQAMFRCACKLYEMGEL